MDRRLIRLRSAASAELYFNFEPDVYPAKGDYSATRSTWWYDGTFLILAYPNKDEVKIEVKFEMDDVYVRLRLPHSKEYYDIYDTQPGKLELWPETGSVNQDWIVESGSPVTPDEPWIKSKWSPLPAIRALQQRDYDCSFRLRQANVRTFRYAEAINPIAALMHIPLVDVNGDNYVRLASSKQINFSSQSVRDYCLLNYDERRLARKMVVASSSLCFAKGGLHDTDVKIHKKSFPLIILSIAGAQFEFRELEFKDFIVSKEDKPRPPLFPHFYPKGVKPSYNDAKADKDNLTVGNDCILLVDAYRRSVREDLFLILSAFNEMIPEGKNGRLHMVGFGLGFFAHLDMEYSLTKILTPIFVDAFVEVLKTWNKLFPRIAVIDFSARSGEGALSLSKEKLNHGHIQVESREADLLDPPADDCLVGVVNPSDVYSYKGNEFGYDSVEALLGNNTDLRYNQVLLFNPTLMKKDVHRIVDKPWMSK